MGTVNNTGYIDRMVHRDPSDLRVKLADTATRAWCLNGQLETAIHHRETLPGNPEGGRPTVVHASLPWNSRVAFLIMELHELARRLETELLAGVSDRERARGGSSGNTELALKAIVNLTEATPDDQVLEVLRLLDRWCTRAELTLGLIDGLAHLPARDGEPEMRCPWCDYLTLRVKRVSATAHCVNPGCVYGPDDRRRPTGTVETDILTGEIMIYWQGKLPEEEEEVQAA